MPTVAVLAKKSVPLCKICKSERRADIDAILELRSNLTRGPDTPDGKRGPLLWTLPKVLEQMGEWGIDNPTEENVKKHWKNHCEVVKGEQIEAAQHAILVKLDELAQGGRHADPDEVLRLVITLYDAELREKIARGEKTGIAGDLMMKAQNELTRRAHSETQNELLTMFGQGVGEALKVIASGPLQPQLEAPDVIDQEPVEVEFEPIEVAA